MSLVAGAASWGRSTAALRFTETLTFYTVTETEDPVTFRPVETEEVLKAGVAGRVKFSETIGRDVESGGQFPVVGRREIHVGVGAVEARPGVMVRCTASAVDPGLVGRVFRVSDRSTAGQVTAWRYPVEEVS